MSVDVKVENFDLKNGLEASVIIDGEKFTINIGQDSVQKVLAGNAMDLTQENLDKISDDDFNESVSVKSNISFVNNPLYDVAKKNNKLFIDLTEDDLSEFNSEAPYPNAPTSDLSVDKNGAAGAETTYGYQQALDIMNEDLKKIDDEISVNFSVQDSVKTNNNDEDEATQKQKANEDFDKELRAHTEIKSKQYLTPPKIRLIVYHRSIHKKLREMNDRFEHNNTPYGLQFKERIQQEFIDVNEEIKHLTEN